ncbi:ubiquinone biosynthesis accessory factor UbiK [Kangiella aquimarina]|uniref:Ubiquinone biosynthesis accessory factor UbiK n=1 Tax=Kangiella aquimarina TaxID=261965 RepID=A0ABZ0X5G4_9GAMM|nr:accessory factor UbiK family protein [Kangiella aquimarina]WQG85623.1 accessory factor UbiK family protein [Kangiella aquimarina]
MIDPKVLDDIASKLSDAIPPSVKNTGDEFAKQAKQILQSQLAKLDLVTREEFDAQTKVLQRTRLMLAELEKKLADIEAKL